MARLLGGTSRIPNNSFTLASEQPDQPDVLQRRFNFFDYVADGQLNGAISIAQLRMEAHTLLPTPDAFAVVDRQRSSGNGFLVDPTADRNFTWLQHIQPTYQFVPKSAVAKYRGLSPAAFHVDRDVTPTSGTFPVFELFNGTNKASTTPFRPPGSPKITVTPTTVNLNTSNSPSSTTTPTATTATNPTAANTGTSSTPTPTTGATNTSSSSSTPATTSANNQAASLLQAIQNLASSHVGQPSPAGTNVPPTSTVSSPTSSGTTSSTLQGGSATPTPSSATTLPSATPLSTSNTGTTTSPVTNANASTVNHAAAVTTKPAPKNAAHTSKSKGFFNDAIDSIKKAFHL
jgi:hypothetical protein